MPLSFETHLHGARHEPDDVMVSRIGFPKPRPTVHMPMKRQTATSANKYFFSSPPIEKTIHQRQALAASASAPVLRGSPQRTDVMLPRIGTSKARGRIDEPMGRSGPAWANPYFGSIQDYSLWSATSPDGMFKGNVGGVTLLTRPKPGLDSNDNNWCGVLNGDYKVPIPFDTFREDSDRTDADAFVRWYRYREADGEAELSRDRCPLPQIDLLPWSGERDAALLGLKSAPEGSGRALRLLAKADLFDHLDFKAPLRGVEAMLEALAFRCESIEKAVEMIDCNGSGRVSLMEFVGSMGLLGIDFEDLVGMDDVSVFLGLDQDRDGLVKVDHLLNLRYALKPKRNRPPSRASEQDQEEQTIVSLEEIRLQAPAKDPPDVTKARVKWSRIARWMSAATQRSIALRTERLIKGWRVDAAVVAQHSYNEETNDETLNKAEASDVIANGDVGSPSSCSPPARSPSSRSPKKSLQRSSSSGTNVIEPKQRRRTSKANPRELASESLATMREHEASLKVLFNASASIRLPDGTPQMSRADLYIFFQDLQLADWARHVRVTPKRLDKLYDEALDLQCKFTRIGNGLTFWSMKVVLSNVIEALGLGWRCLVEMNLHPDALENAARIAAEP